MKKSLAKNSLFYFSYTFCNMLFPFIVSIYAARILLPENIGEVAYAQNIVNYFAILAFLGLPTYGIREISIARNNMIELSKVYSELFLINLISTIVFSVLYYGLIIFNDAFRNNLFLYSIVGISVIFNVLNISWLYDGLEEYGYVAIRNAIVKFVILIVAIVIIRDENDIIPYAAITVLGIGGNGLINIIHAKKYVRFSLVDLNLKRHLKPVFLLVMVNLAIEIYTMIDITMLGYMLPKEHVAFYSYASKVNKMIMQVTNTFTMILVPRISLYYKEGNVDEFNELLTTGLKIILLLAFPIIIGMQFVSVYIFILFFGAEYVHSAFVEKVLCLLILIYPIGYLLGSRVLLVSNNERKMLICVSIGAVVNVFLNLMLIPWFYEMGAAIASVISEFIIMIIYVILGKRLYKLKSYFATLIKILFSSVVLLIYLIITDVINDSVYKILIQIFGATIVYYIVLIMTRESIVWNYTIFIYNKFKGVVK